MISLVIMQWQAPENIASLLFVALIPGTICILAFSRRKGNPAAKTLAALMLMTTFWTLFYILELSVISKQAQIFANDLSYIPIVTVPVLLLIFIMTTTGYQNLLTPGRILLLFMMPAIILILIWTSEHHSLFYSKIEFIQEGHRAVMTIERGLFYWINIIYSYICLLIGTIIAFISLSRGEGVFKSQALILASGTILPWIGSIIDISVGKIAGIHMMQASFVVTGILFILGISKFSFIYFSPIGRHVVIDRMEDLMLVTDNFTRVVDINPAMAAFLNKPKAEIIGKTFKDALSGHENIIDRIYNMSSDTTEISAFFGGANRHFNVSKIPLITGKRILSGTLVLMSDVTMRVENELRLKEQLQQISSLQKELREQAIRDPLTGLYNRRFLEEVMNQQAARLHRENGSIGFLYLDIDNFKYLNDSFGHAAGDEVLKNLSRILMGNIRESDIACRYGGEEFLIMFIDTDPEDIFLRAEKMRTSFENNPSEYSGTRLPATFSAGIAAYPLHSGTIEEAIKSADSAMYKAKASGRNRTVMTEKY